MIGIKALLKFGLITASLALVIYLSVHTRMSTINSPTVLDYDPFWFYRHAEEIVENGYKIPQWDIKSYYPPGRPYESFQGWPYTIAMMYKILNYFIRISLNKVGIISPLILAALAPIPAFFLGKLLSNNLGGLATAMFSVLTPTLLGVSMAGYSDTDMVVVFYTFLSILATFLAISQFKKGWINFLPFAIIAIFVNLFFVFNWGAGWLPQLFFLVLIPAYFLFKLVETKIHHKRLDINIISQEIKPFLIPLLAIIFVSNIIGFSLGWGSVSHSFLGGLGFTGMVGILMSLFFIFTLTSIGLITGLTFFRFRGAIIGTLIGFVVAVLVLIFGEVSVALLVNISVAELQPINIFTKEGFNAVADRVGMLPTLLTIIGLPILIVYKIFKKEKLLYTDLYLFLWMLITFYLIIRGVRFSLLFSTATAASAGYVIGNSLIYMKNRNPLIISTVFGFIALFSLIFISNAIQFGYSASGMVLSQNWYDMLDWLKENADKDSLISTWWDPGHIITGYTGLKAHADGAHCPPEVCIPYNHNIRIRDMGRIFSTNNESESVSILEKYKELTPEQCEAAREKFEDMPEDACKPVSDIYVIASSDLIGKYYWMSFFGSYDEKTETGNGKNFAQLQFSGFDQSGFPTYGNIITLIQRDEHILGVINIPQQGIRNAIIKDILYFQLGQEVRYRITTNETNTMDGMLFVDSTFRTVVFMEPSIRDSIFTNMFFFNGNGIEEFNVSKLQNFQLVYSNPEIRIFKLIS